MAEREPEPGQPLNLHSSAVDIDGSGILIIGPSGSGKSSLALQLIVLGANLVSDDQTLLSEKNGAVFASAPDIISGLIEARGVGILKAQPVAQTQIGVIVDMGTKETKRFPDVHHATVVGVSLPCLRKIDAVHFPAAILQYVKAGRRELI